VACQRDEPEAIVLIAHVNDAIGDPSLHVAPVSDPFIRNSFPFHGVTRGKRKGLHAI
jgi:hypothetical protein